MQEQVFALKAGADIVVELPVYYALSSAENFAKGAVLTLNTMKAASICFGAETDNADCLAKDKPYYNIRIA